MKKILSLVMAVLMLAAVLTACAPAAPATTTKPQAATQPNKTDPQGTTTQPQGTTKPSTPAAEGNVVNADEFTGDLANWEFDTDLIELVDGKLHFDTNFPGDYCAAMLKKPLQNGTFKVTLTVNELADFEDMYMTELFIIARASLAGTTWNGEDCTQTGYTISAWGDLSEFCLGRCGYDDAFGTFKWNINDGQPHVIEITTTNNADNTAVEIVVTVDGEEIARAVDDGTKVKKERPNLYPDAGNLVVRAKWMDITIG